MKSSLFLNSILKVNFSFMKTYRCTGADVALQNLSVENIPPKSLSSYSSTCSKQFWVQGPVSMSSPHKSTFCVNAETAVEGFLQSITKPHVGCCLCVLRCTWVIVSLINLKSISEEWIQPSPLTHVNAANIRGNFACLMMHVVRICEFTVWKLPLTGVLYVSIIWVKSKSSSFPGIKNLGFEITSV